MEPMNVMKMAWKAYTPNIARLIIGTSILLVLTVLLGLFSMVPLLSLFFVVGTIPEIFFLSLSLLFLMVSVGLMGAFANGYVQFLAQAYGPSLEDASKGRISSDKKLDVISLLKPVSLGKEMALVFYSFAFALFLIFGIPLVYTGSLESLLFSVPFALMFLFFTSFAPCYVAFKKSSCLEAFGKSFEFTVRHFWGWLGLSALLAVAVFITLLVPVLGPVILFMIFPWLALTKIGFFKKA